MDNTEKILIIISILVSFQAYSQQCLMSDFEAQFYHIPETSTARATLKPHCLLIDLYCDYFTVQEFSGDRDSVRTWMKNQWDSVAILYKNEGVNIAVSSYNIPNGEMWADTMPFLTVQSLFYRLGLEVDNTGPGHFVHFMTSRDLGASIAWLGSYCSMRNPVWSGGKILTYYWNYAVSTSLDKILKPLSSNQWNYESLAHEMGHNLGLNHTHDCVWGPSNNEKVDTCWSGGVCPPVDMVQLKTIMSYCRLAGVGIDLLGVGFGTLPTERMLDNIASCGKFDVDAGPVVLTGLINEDVNAKKIIFDRGGTQFVTKLRSETDIEINMPVELNPGVSLFVNQNLCGIWLTRM